MSGHFTCKQFSKCKQWKELDLIYAVGWIYLPKIAVGLSENVLPHRILREALVCC